MKIHEYQAREIFSQWGVPVSHGKVASTPEEAESIAREIGAKVVIKAQVQVGGRGKAGGVKFAESPAEARKVAEAILSMKLKGLPVKKVLVAQSVDVAAESYLGVVVDRARQAPVIMVSAAGGVDIEEVARETPEKIHKLEVDPVWGLQGYQARKLAMAIEPDPKRASQVGKILMSLYRCFVGTDASLAEINPLATTPDGEVVAIDAKINLDDNGLFRHRELEQLRDPDVESRAEVQARDANLSYVKLDGSVGCLVNGAGLAMATMDLVKHFGGEPANFLDIGGSSSPEKVSSAMKILLADRNVKSVLVNIFGGITRCDDVAQGIVDTLSRSKVRVPVVARLTGTNQEEARKLLEKQDMSFAETMEDAVKQAVRHAMTAQHGA